MACGELVVVSIQFHHRSIVFLFHPSVHLHRLGDNNNVRCEGRFRAVSSCSEQRLRLQR
jgi:hypothetical protein